MKNKQFAIGLTVGIVAMMCIAAAEYDLNKGIDLSSKTSVTTSQLNQLVDNGTVATNKGMLIYSTATPDTTNNTRYSRFLWLDASANPPTVKVYNTNTAVWTNITATATIADNSVTAGKLATSAVNTTNITDGAVTTAKLPDLAITSAKLNLGAVSNVHVAGYTLQSTNIATNGIASFNVTAGAITGDKIASGSLSNVHFSASGFTIYNTNIATGTIGSNQVGSAALSITNLPTGTITAAYMQSGVLPSSTNFTGVAIPAAGATTTVTHSLPGMPQAVTVVLYCTGADANTGYTTGDMIPIKFVGNPSGGMDVPEFSYWLTATTVNILRISTGGTFYLLKKSDGVATAVSSTANFNIRVYLTYTP